MEVGFHGQTSIFVILRATSARFPELIFVFHLLFLDAISRQSCCQLLLHHSACSIDGLVPVSRRQTLLKQARDSFALVVSSSYRHVLDALRALRLFQRLKRRTENLLSLQQLFQVD